MLTIEHEDDATIVTTIDEAAKLEDVQVILDAETIYIRQLNEFDGDTVELIILSHQQFNDILAAMNLPEGAYYVRDKDERPDSPKPHLQPLSARRSDNRNIPKR